MLREFKSQNATGKGKPEGCGYSAELHQRRMKLMFPFFILQDVKVSLAISAATVTFPSFSMSVLKQLAVALV
ncbi:MAG TPA: hypothetical protein VL171_08970, partial [Verrucomicrobiae bacterium]|nr:hypothetical protein [Verrucomicrobiae bacterium]